MTASATNQPPSGQLASSMSEMLAQNWWAVALRGVAAILFGLLAAFAPVAVVLSIALLFGAYLFVDGVLGVVMAVRRARKRERWGLLLAEAALNLAMGAIALLFPGGAVLAFVIVTAAWALLTGGLMVGSAFRLNPEHGRLWLVLSGLLSIVFGVLLAIAPLIGAIVLTWWLGAYALLFGASLLVLAMRLRKRRRDPRPGSAAPQAA